MVYVQWGEGTFLEESFLPPYPHLQRILKHGFYFFMIICALIGRTYNVRTNPRSKVFSQVFFKKFAGA